MTTTRTTSIALLCLLAAFSGGAAPATSPTTAPATRVYRMTLEDAAEKRTFDVWLPDPLPKAGEGGLAEFRPAEDAGERKRLVFRTDGRSGLSLDLDPEMRDNNTLVRLTPADAGRYEGTWALSSIAGPVDRGRATLEPVPAAGR